jgi:hypothetical protein
MRARGARHELDLVTLPARHGLDERPAPPTQTDDACIDHAAILMEIFSNAYSMPLARA